MLLDPISYVEPVVMDGGTQVPPEPPPSPSPSPTPSPPPSTGPKKPM